MDKQQILQDIIAIIHGDREITPVLLQQQFIDKWDGHTPLYGNTPITLMKQQ